MSVTAPTIFGCGYIGKKIAGMMQQQQLAPGCIVYSTTSLKQCEAMGLKSLQCNLDEMQQDAVFSEKLSETIVYLVPPPPKGLTDTRMTRFISLLDSSEEKTRRIVLISTTGVYGDCQGDWIDETRPANPQADRACRRLDAETQLQKYCDENSIALVILRVPGIYAADKLPLKRITSGEPIVREEDSGFTNRIHADDLAAFCVEAALSDVQPGVYNCCDGHPSTMNDYFMRVAKAKGIAPPKEISLEEAQHTLSTGMLSYLAESKRIHNDKLRRHFKTSFRYADLTAGLKDLS